MAVSEEILDEIFVLLNSTDKIQYTEFVAFWKSLDISFSIFKNLPGKKSILMEILDKYCHSRRIFYDKLGYSNITIQALYDSGLSRKMGVLGILKILDLVKNIFGNFTKHIRKIDELQNYEISYFQPDNGDKVLFEDLRAKYGIIYQFGIDHQGKLPDIVLKIKDQFFIIEAKHIKELGGAQDKQILEVIEFIKYSESSNLVHYISFVDGLYFSNNLSENKYTKINRQKESVVSNLQNNLNNFFVNTAGFKKLLENIRAMQ